MRLTPHRPTTRDEGNVLPLVLVVVVVLSMVVGSLAVYTVTSLNYGKVVEARADRLAAADGGMRYSIEKLKFVGHHDCPKIDPPEANGADVTLTCTPVGPGFVDTAGYALVLTGEDVPTSPTHPECTSTNPCALLQTQSAAVGDPDKKVGGLVYMSRLSFDLKSPLMMEDGQLQYTMATEADCDVAPSMPAGIVFAESHLGLNCTTRPWSRDLDPNGLFSAPMMPVTMLPDPVADLNPPNLPDPDGGACKVFQPGYYDASPALGSYNYFMSGNYVFDGFTLTIQNGKVTMGAAVGGAGDTQSIPNEVCDGARSQDLASIGGDPTKAGVTVYLKGNARFDVRNNGSLEILRRKQGRQYVSIHDLDNTFDWRDSVITQGPGSNKDMAIHGMVWAPRARITFAEVANLAKGQLVGGAVISNMDIRAAANTSGLLISVGPNDITGKLLLESTAVLDGQTTTIRSIVDYRPSTKYAAVTSWRVVD